MLEPLKIFFHCDDTLVGTLVSCALPLEGQTILITNKSTKGRYIIQEFEWELENGYGSGVINVQVGKVS